MEKGARGKSRRSLSKRGRRRGGPVYRLLMHETGVGSMHGSAVNASEVTDNRFYWCWIPSLGIKEGGPPRVPTTSCIYLHTSDMDVTSVIQLHLRARGYPVPYVGYLRPSSNARVKKDTKQFSTKQNQKDLFKCPCALPLETCQSDFLNPLPIKSFPGSPHYITGLHARLRLLSASDNLRFPQFPRFLFLDIHRSPNLR